ncbi:uncharacterized protein TNIN_412461 [Trichonephila inaurata madagascariensis]|uniref:Uncharacterized protein n=1 Tax=Trichonephila inaurata madagascariensis TaxID=2747483 RepID=A0A8X6Y8U6_9ARAC|nr:uncharacterized protein TNIN_412461 [Trichonephila inaurata madagascariensis]
MEDEKVKTPEPKEPEDFEAAEDLEHDIETTSMSKDESDSSQESDSSGVMENLEDVEGLVVKKSEDIVVEKEPSTEVLEKGEEAKTSKDEDDLSQKVEEDKILEELGEKEKEDLLSREEAELKKEEERREKMKVLLTGYLELKTKKEIEKAMLNEKKILSQWLYPFRGAYKKEWELEMKKLKLGFQKALDYKKSHIHAIQRERKLLELNHLWTDSSYYRMTEELFDFMRMRCEKLKTRYLEELEETKRYYLEREKEIVDKCTKAEERAILLAFMRKSVQEKTLQKAQQTLENYKTEGEFLRAKEMEIIKEKHMTYVEMIAQELQTSISPPEHKMEEIRALFDEWKTKYDNFLELSSKNRKDLEQLGEELPSLELKVAKAKKTLEELQTENRMIKRKEADEIIRFQKISKKYESLRPPLRKMITASEEVMKKLRERKAKLDKIMKLKRFCDQLEMERDTISFQSTFLEEDEERQIKENDCLQLARDVCSEDIEDHNLLEILYRKLSRIKVQNKYLQHDIENLRIENMALRSDMRKYLHLIVSGEWERIPESEFQSMRERELLPQRSRNTNEQEEQSGQKDLIDKNLQLLDLKYGATNKKILKRGEKLI